MYTVNIRTAGQANSASFRFAFSIRMPESSTASGTPNWSHTLLSGSAAQLSPNSAQML